MNSVRTSNLLIDHYGIRRSMQYLVDLVNQEFKNIEQSITNSLSSKQIQILEKMRFNAEQNLVTLEGILNSHYTNEKEFLRPLLGSLLKAAITKETVGILRQFRKVKAVIININFKDSNREQALVKILNIKQSLEDLNQMVETHMVKMDSIVKLLEGILETRKAPQS